MATQTIKTIIKLKQKEYSYWADTSKVAPATKAPGNGEGPYYVPHYGEICLCEITAANQDTQTSPPTVLFKVGNGTDYFKDLNWASALASDVYDWAKASDVKFENNQLVFVGGGADGKDKEIDLSALSVKIPDLTVKQTTSDVLPTGDTVNVVTNVLNSDGDYELTVTRHKVPTKEYVDSAIGAANAAVTYLGILHEPSSPAATPEGMYSQICEQLSTAASKGDFYRAGFTFEANTALTSFPGFHTGDLIIAEKDKPGQYIDGSNWSVIHCHETEEIIVKLRDHFTITDGGTLKALGDETNRDTKGFSIVDISPSGIGETHYLNGKIKRYDSNGATYTQNLPSFGGTFVLANQTNVTYILDCN